MRRSLLLLSSLGVAGLLTACGQTPPDPPLPEPSTTAELAGDWAGSLTESNGDSYDALITIADSLTKGQQGATVKYPGLGGVAGCSGTWTYLGEDLGSFTFSEEITSGAGSACVSGGKVTLTPSKDDTLQMLFVGEGAESNGFLAPGKLPG